MADVGGAKAAEQLREITECPVCMNSFTDPRMLPCIHTFCLECLTRTSEAAQKKSGDKMPCPMCRKDFNIPADGMNGVQKNFFMENLLEFKAALQMGSTTAICDMCDIMDEGKTGQVTAATMRCLQCQDNYCDNCAKFHRFQKATKDHQYANIGGDMKSESPRIHSTKLCIDHRNKLLDYYCSECKKIVCVSCFVESHSSHKCKDVTKVDEEFRQTIEKKSWKISAYMKEILLMSNKMAERKAAFLIEIATNEEGIRKRNQELKVIIDLHTKLLLDELSVIKSKHIKEMENQMEEIGRCCTMLGSFEAYCTELISKGSATDICSSVDQLIDRAVELEKDHEAFIGRPYKSIEVSFRPADLKDFLKNVNSNFVGNVKEATGNYENFSVVLGLHGDNLLNTNDVFKINLYRPNEISAQEQIPFEIRFEGLTAAVYCNTMYVTGAGVNQDEIWKFNSTFGWVKCAYLVQGRSDHCAAFIDEVLYICGGLVDYNRPKSVLDSVEAYYAVTNECTAVGKLVHGVYSSGNCVAFRNSLYIFGGYDKDGEPVSHVQLYDTNGNTCILVSKSMPRSSCHMQAVLWEFSVILIGCYTCFIFNLDTETWQERVQFKTCANYFGLALENERIFIIGGAIVEKVKLGKTPWKCKDDIFYVPLQNILEDKPIEWKIHGKLPKPSFVHAFAKMRFLV